MTSSALRTIRIAAWVAIVLIAGVLVWTFISPKQSPVTSLAASTVGGPFTLTDQKGAPVTEAALKGHPSALFFGLHLLSGHLPDHALRPSRSGCRSWGPSATSSRSISSPSTRPATPRR